jgi:hypothetical protein
MLRQGDVLAVWRLDRLGPSLKHLIEMMGGLEDQGIGDLYVADHPDTCAQAKRLAAVLDEAGMSAKPFGAKNSNHSKINDNLGLADDLSTKELFEFSAEATAK